MSTRPGLKRDVVHYRKLIAYLHGQDTVQDTAQALGLETAAAVHREVELAAKAGHEAIRRELAAQKPEGTTHD